MTWKPVLAGGLLSACAPAGMVNDQLFVRSGDATIPVLVRGNIDQGTLIVFESGGPAGPSIAERLVDNLAFAEPLEEDFAIAYYDRRGIGNAYGSYTTEDLSIPDLVGDLEAVRRVLEARYAPEQMVLMGHSWGGFLSASYLLEQPDTFDAWIPVAGAVLGGDDLYVPYRRDFACRVAEGQQAEAPGVVLWAEISAWCDETPEVEPESPEKDELWGYLDAIDARLGVWPETRLGPVLKTVFGSGYNPIDTMLRNNLISPAIAEQTDGVSLLLSLSAISVPTLVVSGEFDDIAPVELGEDIIEALGTPEDERSHLIIEGGGHYPFEVDPEGFSQAVRALIGAL